MPHPVIGLNGQVAFYEKDHTYWANRARAQRDKQNLQRAQDQLLQDYQDELYSITKEGPSVRVITWSAAALSWFLSDPSNYADTMLEDYGPPRLHAILNAYLYADLNNLDPNLTDAEMAGVVIQGARTYMAEGADDYADVMETAKVICVMQQIKHDTNLTDSYL